MPFQYDGTKQRCELQEKKGTTQKSHFCNKLFVKMLTWAINMNFTTTSPKNISGPIGNNRRLQNLP